MFPEDEQNFYAMHPNIHVKHLLTDMIIDVSGLVSIYFIVKEISMLNLYLHKVKVLSVNSVTAK